MARRLKAMGQPNYINGFETTLHEHMLSRPLEWTRPQVVFVNSMSDLFHEDVPLDRLGGPPGRRHAGDPGSLLPSGPPSGPPLVLPQILGSLQPLAPGGHGVKPSDGEGSLQEFEAGVAGEGSGEGDEEW